MRIYEKQRPPKYIQIYEWVRDEILEGRLKVGDKIPTEPVLAEKFGASRMTVRKAMDPLVLEGMVERRQGQGSFVTASQTLRLTYDTARPARFSHEMQQAGLDYHHELVSSAIVKAAPELTELLGKENGSQAIELTTVLYTEAKPMIIDRSYFAYPKYASMLDMDLDQPPFQLLTEGFGQEIKQVRQSIGARETGPEEMRLFGLAHPISCLYLEWTSCDIAGGPLSVSLCYYRGDSFKFKIPAAELVTFGDH